MTEPAEPGGELPRAFLTVAGRTIARHQLELALAAECRRIVCLAPCGSPELSALRAEAHNAGVQFQIVRDASALPELIGPNDDLVVFAEGLLAEPRGALAMLEPANSVLVQPIEPALAAGFERIDAHRAAGGAMRIPGNLVERLRELPPDCDVPSALTRIALQEGVPMRDIAEAALTGPRWRLVRSAAEAHALERDWIALGLREARGATPSRAVARFIVASFGSSMLHAGGNSRVLALGAAVLLLLALGAGWLGAAISGMCFVAGASLVREVAAILMRIEGGMLEPRRRGLPLLSPLGWLVDAVIVVLAVWQAPPAALPTLTGRAFAPLVLVALLRLAPALFERRRARWIEDRAVVALVLALAAALGELREGIELLALLIAAGAIVKAGNREAPGSG